MAFTFIKNLFGIQKNEWEKFLRELDREGRNIFYVPVSDFFIPDKIDFMKFAANWHAIINDSAEIFSLYAQFDEMEKELSNKMTKSIQGMDLLGGVPLGYPNWFVAAYPDVMKWFTETSEQDILEALGFQSIEEYEKYDRMDDSRHFKPELLRKFINFYTKKVCEPLECSTDTEE